MTAPNHTADPLVQLAYNLRWAWDSRTAQIFQDLAPDAWEVDHNPVDVLRRLGADSGKQFTSPSLGRGQGGGILNAIETAHRGLTAYLDRPPREGSPRVAYFCLEFAITECLRLYSGGLGVLAGDHLKAASDARLPLVAVGLLYRYGYFEQQLDESGYQVERYEPLDPEALPLSLVRDEHEQPVRVDVPFPGRTVQVQAWLAQVGCVPLYLLDTDLPENREDDRWITGHLYGGDQDTRIRQEIILGIGGARLLDALDPPHEAPRLYHMNEGHSAFLALELARRRLVSGEAERFDDAASRVARHLLFTTHTPVAAGHDDFPGDLVEAYLSAYLPELGLSHDQLMRLGCPSSEYGCERFSMTVLALRSAHYRNAVSKLHGLVSGQMWRGVGVGVSNTPPARAMDAVTNGVHSSTWAGPEMAALFDRRLGSGWREEPRHAWTWRGLAGVEPAVLWEARSDQRSRLLEAVSRWSEAPTRSANSRTETGGLGGWSSPPEEKNSPLPGEGARGWGSQRHGKRTLVLGFARRFAVYKRAALLLADPDRLARLLGDPERPVMLLLAGKAHPRDEAGKLLMQRVVQASREDRFRGRLVFLANYDVELARLMVQGSDVWLNTPRRLEEASGTSGMKAALNGALHLSELDGWWDEAYQDGLGWGLGHGLPDTLLPEERDAAEAEQLIDLLESQVVPLYFDRDGSGCPQGWLARVSASIQTLAPRFSADRMVIEYSERLYTAATPDSHRFPSGSLR